MCPFGLLNVLCWTRWTFILDLLEVSYYFSYFKNNIFLILRKIFLPSSSINLRLNQNMITQFIICYRVNFCIMILYKNIFTILVSGVLNNVGDYTRPRSYRINLNYTYLVRFGHVHGHEVLLLASVCLKWFSRTMQIQS